MLKHLFQPSSIAVIGASRDPNKLGHIVLRNIIASGYKGKIYPVNHSGEAEILGLPVRADVKELPDRIDLMFFSVPSVLVLPTLKDALKSGKKIQSAVIITAGFKEIGPEGARMEKEIQTLLREHNITTIGPNCIGFIDTATPLNATFSATEKMPPCRHIAFFSQSGALSISILDWAIQEKIGLSKLISLGNKIDVDEVSLLEFLSEDKTVSVILAYLEGIEQGRRFMEVAGETSRKKPIIILKGGSSLSGSRAVSSHTGSLAGQDRAYQAAFIQSGVIRVETISELFDIASAFTPTPPSQRDVGDGLKGPSIAIVTNSGGPGVMAVDRIEKSKLLKIAEFESETLNKLRENFPAGANIYNPVDVIADAGAQRYKLAIESAQSDKNVDGILVIYTPASRTAELIAETIAQCRLGGTGQKSFASAQDKPILACFMGGETAKGAIEIIKQAGIPYYPSPERAIRVFEAMLEWRLWRERTKDNNGIKRIKRIDLPVPGSRSENPSGFVESDKSVKSCCLSSGRNITTDEVLMLLSKYGIAVPDFRIAQSLDEALEQADKIGCPVVLKIISPQISHKTDIGGVQLNLHTPAEVRKAYREIIERVHYSSTGITIKGVMVQKMISGGKEVIIGVSRDRQFGPLIMFGLGGIYVEILKDVSFRLAPLTPSDVDTMIREIKTYPLLTGARGGESSDLQSLKETILKVSQLVMDFPQIAELDINPYKIFPKGGMAIDARISIQ